MTMQPSQSRERDPDEMLEMWFEGLVRIPRRAIAEAEGSLSQAVQNEVGHAGIQVIQAGLDGPA